MVPRNAVVNTSALNTTFPTSGFPATLTGEGSATEFMEDGEIKARIAWFARRSRTPTGHANSETQHALFALNKKRAP